MSALLSTTRILSSWPRRHSMAPLNSSADVQLVGVEQQQDAVRALSEPLDDLREVVRAADALLLTRQLTRRVHEGNLLQDGRVALRTLELTERSSAERRSLSGPCTGERPHCPNPPTPPPTVRKTSCTSADRGAASGDGGERWRQSWCWTRAQGVSAGTVQESHAELVEGGEGLGGVGRQRVAGDDALVVAPCMTATKRSVVGSGPMCAPGKSRSSRYLMNVVLPAGGHSHRDNA